MTTSTTISIACSFGDDDSIVTIRMDGKSSPMVVGLLGSDVDPDGVPETLYLDSLITLPEKHITYLGWRPQGVISTILERVT